MGPIGMPEMMGIFVIALLLFGPKKLPELGRTLGKALTEFRRAKNELKNTFETHMQELEKETRLEPTKEFTPPSYSYPYDDYGRYEEPVPATEHTAIDQAPIDHAAEHGTEPHHLEQPHLTSEALEPPSSVTPAPVTGTVARTNGVRPVSAVADQEHPS